MPRLTISISEEQNDWLASQADKRDRSKAHIIRDILDAHRTGEVHTGEDFTKTDMAALADRVDELESRVATLETDSAELSSAAGAGEGDIDHLAAEPTDRAAEVSLSETPDEDGIDDFAEGVEAYLEEEDLPPKTNHGRGAVVDVFRELRAAGTLKTSELQERVYANYEDHWSDGRTMWNAIDRHLEKVPGVEKGGYGEWEYAGDEATQAEIQSN